MRKKETALFTYRYEIFFFSLLLVLFGSLFFPFGIYNEYIEPIIFLSNVLAGVKLMANHKRLYMVCQTIFIIAFSTSILERIFPESLGGDIASRIKLFFYFFFYSVVTVQLILQVWYAKEVSSRAMMALMGGYICLGLVGFFIFTTIEVFAPGSIGGMESTDRFADDMMYFSYITLLTIGYGDFSPITPVAQRASVLLGLVGQFYLVIIMAVVLEKFTSHRRKKASNDL